MKCPICDEETGMEIGGKPFCIFCESQQKQCPVCKATPHDANGDVCVCDTLQGCRESDRIAEGLDKRGIPWPPPANHEIFADDPPIGAMTEEEKQEYRLDQKDEAERESQHSEIPFHVLPPIQAFTRRLRNEPLTLTFDVVHPGDVIQSLRCGTVTRRQEGGYSDRVTVTLDSGDPGGDPREFATFIQESLSQWFDGAAVGIRPANLPKNAYPMARKGQIEYVTIPED